jgi:RHS repeat-associated protein
MLDNVNLVNLNGRLFGSGVIPRMLSPDPYIPNPGNTQDFNRYSYVNNNPLSLTDPTGFDSAGGPDDSGGDTPGGGSSGGGGGDDGISPITVYGSKGWNGYNGAGGFAAFSSFGGGAVGGQLLNSYLASAPTLAGLFPVNPTFDSTTFLGTSDDSTDDSNLSEISVTAQKMAGGSPSLEEFSDRITAESQDRQNLLDQSKNFTFDTRTYWQRLGQNFARSGSKIADFGLTVVDRGLTVAAFIPGIDLEAIPALVAERGLTADAKFAQATFSRTFSKGSLFAGKSVDEVAAALRSGAMKASDVPVNYIVRDGQTIILNTRSAEALKAAGVPRSQWNGINQTGNKFFEDLLDGQIGRNPGGPFESVSPTGKP